jgi:hypothetical protein
MENFFDIGNISMDEENALLAGNSEDEVTLVKSVQGLVVAEKPSTETLERFPKTNP